MNTKLLMILSALLMAAAGVLLQFAPHEILSYFGVDASNIAALFVQMTGALYLGFAAMNWMAKTVLIGGIYARPLALGNFLHFTVGALALLKYAFSAPRLWVVWIAAIIYLLLAITFGFVFLTHPLKTNKTVEN